MAVSLKDERNGGQGSFLVGAALQRWHGSVGGPIEGPWQASVVFKNACCWPRRRIAGIGRAACLGPKPCWQSVAKRRGSPKGSASGGFHPPAPLSPSPRRFKGARQSAGEIRAKFPGGLWRVEHGVAGPGMTVKTWLAPMSCRLQWQLQAHRVQKRRTRRLPAQGPRLGPKHECHPGQGIIEPALHPPL
jgi:hypothetical protein